MNNFDELDSLLFEHVSDTYTKSYSESDINSIIKKANKIKVKKISAIAAVLTLVIILQVVAILDFKNRSTNNNGTIYTAENATIIESMYEYKNEKNNITNLNEMSFNEIFDMSDYVAIVKIESGLKGINYDKVNNKDNTIEYKYTTVRTIGNMKIMKVLKGDIKEGTTVEFRKKGGKIKYSEYIKYYEKNPYIYRDTETESKYKSLLEDGTTEVYVDQIREDSIELEEGKEYLVCFYKKIWGDYWLHTGKNAIREYNEESNEILNNYSNKWESLDID